MPKTKTAPTKRKSAHAEETKAKKSKKTSKEKAPMGEAARRAYEDQIKATEEQTGARWIQLGFLPDTHEEADRTLEDYNTIRCAYVPQSALGHYDRIYNQLDRDTGGLFMLWTSHTPIILRVLVRELEAVKKDLRSHKVGEAFARAVGLTCCACDVDHWFCDTEDPDSVEKLMAALGRVWVRLLQHSDGELGFATPSSRAAWKGYLHDFQEKVREEEFHIPRWNL